MAVLLLVAGCGQAIEGQAVTGYRAADPAFFFADEVPAYGQTVSNSDSIALAYLRALRRIDVCGFVDRDALAKIGEISSMGTLYALDECDADIKLPGQANRRLVSVQLDLTRVRQPVAFRAGGVAVYESAHDSCDYLLPVDLSRLPGATRLRKPDQPFLRVGLVGEQDCDLTKKLAGAIAQWTATAPLPARDAAAVYPVALAERDPCEVLSVIAGDVDHWDITQTRPYACEFGMYKEAYPDVVSIRLALQPKIVDLTTDGREHRVADGADIYLDTTFCSAVTFVGPPLQRRLPGGDFVDVANVEVRPAVSIDAGEGNCAAALDVAATAAKLFG
jgi:hypothetical protein